MARIAFDVAAVLARQPDGEREVPLALVDPRHLLAADRRLHHRVDVADGEAVAGGLGAVDLDDQVGLAQQIEAAGVGDARHVASSLRRLFDSRSSSARSRPKILTEFSPFTPETASSMLSWMYCEKLKSTPTNSRLSCSLICWTMSSLLRSFGPGLVRLQGHEELGDEGAVGIGAVLAAALLGEHRLDRRVAPDDVAHARHAVHAGLQRDGGRQQGADPQVAFLELGQELGAEPQPQEAAHGEKAQADPRRHVMAAHDQRQDQLIGPADVAHEERLDLVDALRQQDRGHHRRDGEGGDDGAEQGVGVGARHGAEDLALDALHGEQRQERGNGDDHGEEDRLVDLDGGSQDAIELVGETGFAVGRRTAVCGPWPERWR